MDYAANKKLIHEITHTESVNVTPNLTPTIEHIPSQNETKTDNFSQNDEPISHFVNQLFQDALELHASDIHIEPYENHCRIRLRYDGLLHEIATIPLHLAWRITTRLKIIANLNIAERRLPQDGRIKISNPFKIDIRINTCPTLFGEKIVLRILNDKIISLEIDALGLTSSQKALFLSKLSEPQGLILVTGPTGSGKTITLYSALTYLNQVERNLCSVEDPVEIELNGVNQVNINPRIGLDFPMALRTLLRQDPEVIMLGEIRDQETAQIAVQAAQTGHLVLSTLHTNSALYALNRLHALGVPAYNLANSLSLIIAQRLARKLCAHCKQPAHNKIYLPKGCEHCHQGYRGRIGIFELIPISEQMVEALSSHDSLKQMKACAKEANCSFLWEAGIQKIQEGLTSYAEIQRILGDPH